jgi:rod shape determining protein RodA
MRKDWLLFTDIVLIVVIGLTTLYSTVIGTEDILTGGGVVNRQLIFVVIGFAIYFLLSYFDYRFTGHGQVLIPLYLLLTGTLIYLLFFGQEVNNARRWIFFGNFQIQPSEFAKIIVIFLTAWLLSLKDRANIWLLAVISFAATSVMAVLIFLQPDAGTSIVLMAMWGLTAFVILPDQFRNFLVLCITGLAALGTSFILSGTLLWGIAAGVVSAGISILAFLVIKNTRWIMIATVVLGIFVGMTGRVMWDSVLEDYQKERIESYINPAADTQGAAFQVDQSKVAIGSGMLFGKGFGHGTQSKLNFLPEHQTDFIFAAFAEEFGLVGSLFLLALYALAILRIFQIGALSADPYGMMLCSGIGIKLLIEVFVNVGMNLGITPATGVPLPLISAGGSIFLATMFGFGIVQSIKVHSDVGIADDG